MTVELSSNFVNDFCKKDKHIEKPAVQILHQEIKDDLQ